ncbi:MAG: DUF1456 family protein [Pseudomonadales bacterium]|nr:DUF1456 family protein [Pseudomonadales bacterium]
MQTNDCLRRLRYILDLNDNRMIRVCAEGGLTVSREVVSRWLKRDDDEDFLLLEDVEFSKFLNGLIVLRRGPSDRQTPPPEEKLSNNAIFRKLKIAFNLDAEAILETLALADFKISKHELSAFFRKVGHRQYRKCKDQILRNFLKGLQIKHYESRQQAART